MVWAKDTPSPDLVAHVPPVLVELVGHAKVVPLRQCPGTMNTLEGIRPHVQRLLETEVRREYQCPRNTLCLPVCKSGANEYRPVQEPPTVHTLVVTLHPSTLLSLFLSTQILYTVLVF